ncbi:hypothetical protein LIER_15409 [Lithospermum erythrorhizon]|uniref:Uncharacterized protein n=1 Tax=Lithospermum erythrorhizon TaxID=34254 RepID=A0AAV3Q5B0_LITER
MVKLGELAGRILKKPSLCNSCNLEEIAKEIDQGVKVPYCPSGLKIEDSNKLVYSPEEVKLFGILSEVSAGPVRKRPKFEAA